MDIYGYLMRHKPWESFVHILAPQVTSCNRQDELPRILSVWTADAFQQAGTQGESTDVSYGGFCPAHACVI